jgi:dihydrofolate synthase/folylpolyglutamate synthase
VSRATGPAPLASASGVDAEYVRTLGRLYALRGRGVALGLDRVRRVAAALHDPQDVYPVFHVGGTNGKGSTAAMLAAMLAAGGRRVGLYTSPHLCRLTERIRVDGREIEREALCELVALVEARAAGVPLTFFELVTLAAFEHFRRARVDVAVIEVGLGGRLDATNVVRSPACAIVTGVALDHEDYLGAGLAAIAREKAGIWKPGCPAVVALPDDRVAAGELAGSAARLAAPLYVRGRDFDLVPLGTDAGLRYDGPGAPLEVERLGLAGAHQRGNAALALAALGLAAGARGLILDAGARARGLANVSWPGRLETVPGSPTVLLDCAHNPDAARALASALPRQGDRPICLVFGALSDKRPVEMLAALAPIASRVWVVAPPSARAADPEPIARAHPGASWDHDPARALAAACAAAPEQPGAVVLVTGSVYLVGLARQLLLDEPVDPVAVADPLEPSRR